MLYCVERDNSGVPDTEAVVLFDLAGNPAEVERFGSNVGALAMRALKVETEIEDAYEVSILLTGIADKYIPVDASTILMALVRDIRENDFLYGRLEDIVKAGAAGKLTAAEVFQEHASLLDFTLDHSQDHEWLTGDGLFGNIQTSLKVEPLLFKVDDEPTVYADVSSLAPDITFTARALQCEIVRSETGSVSALSNQQHDSFGTVDDDGTYTPIVTLLHAAIK